MVLSKELEGSGGTVVGMGSGGEVDSGGMVAKAGTAVCSLGLWGELLSVSTLTTHKRQQVSHKIGMR